KRSTDDPSLVEDIGGRYWQHPKGEAIEMRALPPRRRSMRAPDLHHIADDVLASFRGVEKSISFRPD
ncbi:hypothetical protein, partial [Bradyrhizobium japonicum]|uniref:hypothetical protein n=1 Tax=Bradyrhizobium japonicum TaxID=375 RepID=UPI001BA851CA